MKRKILFYCGVVIVVLGGFFAILIAYLSQGLPSVDQIAEHQVVQSTKIYDREGKVLLYEINGGQKRTVVPFEEIPQQLKDATILIEDERFYQEPAFDWRAIVRAVFTDLKHGKIVQGASTITQQLARNAFLSPEQTITRKIREILLAIQIDRHYTKDQILGLYLNQIPYGLTAYGVEAAGQTYFGKSAKELTLAESAILAALPQAPSHYSPWSSHKNELIDRQRLILKKMFDRGKITRAEYNEAIAEKVAFLAQNSGIKAPHFVIDVQDYLVEKYGEDLVREGGLKVISTLNWQMQQAAEKAVADRAAQNEKLYKGKNAALVAEDPQTGQILAMVGSRNYFDTQNDGNFNVASQGKRQPGSALKPFVYMTAFKKGYTPNTVLFDVPTEFSTNHDLCPALVNFSLDRKECFHPQNYSKSYQGPVSMRYALGQSLNVPAVETLYLVGLNDAVKTLNNFGITTIDDPNTYGLSLVLGGGAVRLLDLVGAYSTLATDGTKHNQSLVLEMRDHENNLLESYEDHSTSVVAPQYPRLVNNILSDVSARQGLFQSSLPLTVFPDYQVALKTGTSNDYRDAWTLGYTPTLAAGVWAGNNDNAPMQRSGSSILAAIPIWHAFMEQALPLVTAEPFVNPDPLSPNKPILRGELQELHSILYYIDRNDPTGPSPANPADDYQFANWEYAVQAWAQTHQDALSHYTPPSEEPPPSISSPPQVTILTPEVGTFVQNEIGIHARIQSNREVIRVMVYLNDELVKQLDGTFGTNYDFSWSFISQNMGAQNVLKIAALDSSNTQGTAEVIIYGQM